MSQKIVFGLLAPRCSGEARKKWNAEFRKRGVDAFFDFYPTKTRSDLELRLSEMFLHERRGYTVGETVQTQLEGLLDELDASAVAAKTVDTIVNREGILVGYCVGATPDDLKVEERLRIWGI